MASLPRMATFGSALGAALAVALASATPAVARPNGTFVGQAGRTAVGVVLQGASVNAYVCDGRRLARWTAVRNGRSRVRLAGGALLLTGERTVRVRLAISRQAVRLRRATGRAGLYRADTRRHGKRRRAGWIVLPSGRQVGAVETSAGTAPAPKLSTTTLTAGGFVAGFVLPPGPQAVIADFDGDGFDLGGRTTTTLLGGRSQAVQWTRPGDDDRFIAVDADVLRTTGFALRSESGRTLSGVVLVRGGLTVTTPKGASTATTEGSQLLALLDQTRDGRLSAADSTFPALRTFHDGDGDGTIQEKELQRDQEELDEVIVETRQALESAKEAFRVALSIITTSAAIRRAAVATLF